ncbi:MAG: nucleoside recognition protein [Halobellus sp.]|uniref:nucleoside recognition protein n=1 Tax=Halobellus sp. TaxID=1979212 RepID=UPI0035D41B3E
MFIGVGVFLANVAVGFGLVEKIAAFSKYLTRPANLPDEVGTAIVTTAASTTAGYGMLADFRESERLTDAETLIAVTMNTFFGFVQHIFTFYAPVLIPILGLEVGLLYVGARAAIALGITITGVFAGAVLLSRGSATDRSETAAVDGGVEATDGGAERSPTPPDSDDDSPAAIVRTAAEKTWPKLTRIIPRLAIIYVAVTLLVRTQDLRAITGVAEPLTTLLGLPGASLPVVAVFAFDTTAGAATIAPMIGPTFTPRTAVATMLLGGIISFAVSTFKRSIPFQYGIWGPTFGSKVIAVNTALKVVFITAALAVLLVPV